ncbi:MAG: heme ABC exporter ATP-binding protein CcmA [Paracoccus denitrificans]|nr:MAG: heme ABC exporter ATP-binding protein CcmA [Paracoccus denitrificans]PZO84483.1 MAG: heme ABC exporter ATP-binding protein CcmA [Paracoccus denitrificans]
MTLLSARDLSVARGGILLLEGVSFDVAAGDALILRGANGIGKTSLLRCLVGLQRPVSGQVKVAPDCAAYAAHLDGIKPTLSVSENLSFWRAVFGGPAIEPAITAMNLAALAQRDAGALSAGQRRRVTMARVMVSGRPLWVLDEPTVSMDAASVSLVEDAIAQHRAAGGAVIVALHGQTDIPEARVLDLTAHRAATPAHPSFDEAFA